MESVSANILSLMGLHPFFFLRQNVDIINTSIEVWWQCIGDYLVVSKMAPYSLNSELHLTRAHRNQVKRSALNRNIGFRVPFWINPGVD